MPTVALESFMRGGDVFVCLPTGSGKSLCYACLPYIFDILRKNISGGQHASIAVVVLPLSTLAGQHRAHQTFILHVDLAPGRLYGTTSLSFIGLHACDM